MKSKILIAIFFVYLMLNNALAQYVPNGGFENWESRILYEEPVSWNTGNMESFIANTATAISDTDSYSGKYALRLTSIVADNDTMAGYAFCMGSYAGGNVSDTLLFKGGFPMSASPDSLFGYFKYNLAPEDSAIVLVSFKKAGIIIGQNIYSLKGSQATYAKKKWAINTMADTPDTAIIAFACTNPDNPKVGSWLLVDSIWFGGTADTIPNADFEIWEQSGYSEPAQWMTSNLFAYLFGGDTSVTATADAHSGNYAMRIESIQTMMPSDSGSNAIVVGFAMPFSGSFDFREGITSFDINFNPTLLTGYYKFIPLLNDTAIVYVLLSDNEQNTYPFGMTLLPTNDYQQFQIPLTYPEGVQITSVSLLFSTSIYFMQGDGKSGEIGSVLYLDDINLFNPCDTFPEYHIMPVDEPFCDQDSILIDAGDGWAGYLWSTNDTTQTITVPVGGEVLYNVVVTSENGCRFYDTIAITCKNQCDTFPDYHIKEFAEPTCDDNTLVIDAGDGWAEYLWSTEATTQTITVPALVQAVYSVTVTSVNDCKFYDTVEVVPPICDAINDKLHESMQVNVYPNPSYGEFAIEFINAESGQYVTEITTLEGRVVYKENVNIRQINKTVKVNISDFPAGIYMLKISGGRLNYTGLIEKN